MEKDENVKKDDEIKNFDDLIEEVRGSKDANKTKLERWRTAFDSFWKDDGYQWEKLVSLLPVLQDRHGYFNPFKDRLLLKDEEFSLPSLIFLVTIAKTCIFDRRWTAQFSNETFEFYGGCLNLINFVVNNSPASKELKDFSIEYLKTYFVNRFCSYPLLTLALSIKYPEIFEKKESSILCLKIIDLSFERIKKEINFEGLSAYFDSNAGSAKDLAKNVRDVFGNDKAALCNLLNKALSKDINLPCDFITDCFLDDKYFKWEVYYEELVLTALSKSNSITYYRNIIGIFSFESLKISEDFKIKAETSEFLKEKYDCDKEVKDRFFKLWARYLVVEHGFEFYWYALLAKNNSFGSNLDERLSKIDRLIREYRFHNQLMRDEDNFDKVEKDWRIWKAIFRPLGSLFTIYQSHPYGREAGVREEIWIRQIEAIEILNNHQEFMEWVIVGILEYAQGYWDWLDPIILGLPEEIVIKVLENYLGKDHSHQKHYHAKRLLSHTSKKIPIKGFMDLQYKGGLLEAVEGLYDFSQSKLKGEKGQTWIGDAAVESLAFGAIGKANNEFNEYFDSQFGHDEHEHVAILIEALHKNFNRLSQVVTDWIKQKYTVPAVFRTSIKRFPKRAHDGFPQEGGEKGYQADLAVILDCDIPELMLTERVTFFQAKKISQIFKSQRWEDSIAIDQVQLERALGISEHFYYLFFLHSEIGKSPIVLPAKTVKDICNARSIKKIPLPLLLRSSREFPAFLLNDLIGLWIGDTSQDIISEIKKGGEVGQGPRILLEVHISRGDNG